MTGEVFFSEARRNFVHAALAASVLCTDAEEMLDTVIQGKRLRDVGGLLLVLAI